MIRRLAATIPVLIGVTLVSFVLTYLLPGDPARAMAGERYREEDLVRIRRDLGLDRPLPEQYARYMGRVVRGDFGTSYATQQPVRSELFERFPRTLLLASASLVVAILIGIPLGTLAAARAGGVIDRLATVVALLGVSLPVFWTAMLFLSFFAIHLRLLPPSGYIDANPLAIVLPSLTLGLRSAAVLARMTRASVLETLQQDFMRTARAKGVRASAVLLGHGLRASLVPIVTLAGLDFGSYLSGSVLTESIFAWPGVGQYALHAILRRDFPAIQATVLLLAVVFVAVNFLVDALYGALDPRIRLRKEGSA
jgi:peptide/nickel transport system permease protein/oligopeptide transport system permease protein